MSYLDFCYLFMPMHMNGVMVYVITNVYMQHIYKVIHNLSVYIMNFELGLPKRSNQDHKTCCI